MREYGATVPVHDVLRWVFFVNNYYFQLQLSHTFAFSVWFAYHLIFFHEKLKMKKEEIRSSKRTNHLLQPSQKSRIYHCVIIKPQPRGLLQAMWFLKSSGKLQVLYISWYG